jgi:hypothetical protein
VAGGHEPRPLGGRHCRKHLTAGRRIDLRHLSAVDAAHEFELTAGQFTPRQAHDRQPIAHLLEVGGDRTMHILHLPHRRREQRGRDRPLMVCAGRVGPGEDVVEAVLAAHEGGGECDRHVVAGTAGLHERAE